MGLWAVDLTGRDLFVNGRSVRCALLADGDELQVCSALFRVHYSDPLLPTMITKNSSARAIQRNGSSNGVRSGNRRTHVLGPSPWPIDDEPDSCLADAEPEIQPVQEQIPQSMAGLAGTELAGVLAPLTQHFATMQQQMFDQFKQAMLMMGQMFSDLHRAELALMREELNRLHQVTQELNRLQLELVRNQQSALPRPTNQTALAPANGVAGQRREIEAKAPSLDGPPRPSNGANGDVPLVVPATTPPHTETTRRPNGAAATSASVEGDFHVLLTQRIAALQEERLGLWQKILSYLKPSDAVS
jgi:hypothetical protein